MTDSKKSKDSFSQGASTNESVEESNESIKTANEIGGRKGLEPTRYGDWEKNGIVSDF